MKELRTVSLPFFILILGQFSFAQSPTQRPIIHDLSAALTDVMIVDGFSPPQASRAYYYSHVAYYEVVRQQSPEYATLAGQLNGLDKVPIAGEGVNLDYAAATVFKMVAGSIVYRKETLEKKVDGLVENAAKKLGADGVKSSEAYALLVYKHISDWMSSDNYKKLKSLPRYQLIQEPYAWEPTPPVYHDALEPNWEHLRTAYMKDASSFAPIPPIKFDSLEGSEFHAQAMEVYKIVNEITDQQRMIAKFWDCNPLQTQTEGHFMFNLKQMTPGGHWMALTGIACTGKGLSNLESSSIYTNVCIGLFDGFIASWQSKYEYNLIRPVTYINRYIDKNWLPILETPPFPEYTSAHSVISRCVAEILNARIGSEFNFTDTVETRWGYPARTFESLTQAGIEVSDSRVYGGIHYRMGVDQGMDQGERLGKAILRDIIFKK